MARGNSKTTAAKSKPSRIASGGSGKATETPASRSDVSFDVQQKCLNIFRDTFSPSDGDSSILQEIKSHLYNRDFAAAFGKEEYLRVYASRWSPSRALGYLQIFNDIQDLLLENRLQDTDVAKNPFEVVCLGGGAGAEVVSLAVWMHCQSLNRFTEDLTEHLHARFVDIAAWDRVVSDLHRAVTVPPELSKYASAAAKEANHALLPQGSYIAEFQQRDVLRISEESPSELFDDADLVTLMFTLNELYSTSISRTQQLIAHITASLRPGAHFIIVDSPGSYATVSINGADKKYPMQWLLDYTILGSSQKKGTREDDSPVKWKKLVSDDSRWFRLPPGLRYPIELENMRYQIHLYRRLPDLKTS